MKNKIVMLSAVKNLRRRMTVIVMTAFSTKDNQVMSVSYDFI